MRRSKASINMMFTIMLLAIFSLSLILVAIIGAQVYSSNADRMQQNYDSRTSLLYIGEKLRCQEAENVTIEEISGTETLVITTYANGYITTDYETLIYVHDGKLKELVLVKDPSGERNFEPATGTPIMALTDLTLTKSDKGILIKVVTESGSKKETFIGWRSGL